ncbi:MAG: VOC family protein [Myxococcales bacterium]|nr:VOC family protein [Myxococcales bacterium]
MLLRRYDHVGIRVTDRDRAVRFYGVLGFRVLFDESLIEHSALELINDSGVRLNLIYNGVRREGPANVLMDEPAKWPGLTHVAFIVDDMAATVAELAARGVELTEGPVLIDERRLICFIRDPDGNVVEFDELRGTELRDRGDVEPAPAQIVLGAQASAQVQRLERLLERLAIPYRTMPDASQLPAPLLADGGARFDEPLAALLYVARRYGGEPWAPAAPAAMAAVHAWVARADDLDLRALEDALAGRDWLALERPTVADFACAPLLPADAPELADFPRVRAWLTRLRPAAAT